MKSLLAKRKGRKDMSKKARNNENIEAIELKDKKGITFEDQLARVFDDVLEVGEKIQKGYKPNKTKIIISGILSFLIVNVFLIVLAIFNLLGEQVSLTETLIGTLIPAGLAFILFVCSIVFTILRYKNTYFVVTNKRIVVRSGVFKVDFISMDNDRVVESVVHVSFLDRLLRKNTGTIKFNSGVDNGGLINISHIKDPIKVHQEIKELIKEDKEKS